MVLSVIGTILGLAGLAFADSYPLLLVFSFAFGFFLMGGRPDLFSVQRGNLLSCAGGDLTGVADAGWSGIRHSFCFGNGSGCRKQQDAGDDFVSRSGCNQHCFEYAASGIKICPDR